MRVREIMRPALWTVEASDTLGHVERMMARRRVAHVFVVASGRLVGALSARDILDHRVRTAGNGGWWQAPVRGAMQRVPVTVAPDEAIDEAAMRILGSRLDTVPVVEQGLLVGVVGATDVLDEERRPVEPELLRVADAMSEPAITVRPDDLLVDAVARMVDHGIRHLPVVDGDALVGMLSDRDVRAAVGAPSAAVAPWPESARSLTVREAMTPTAITVPSDRPLRELAGQLADDKIGALPVTDPAGKLVGIVSYVDVLRAMAA